jgi:hypothetical protein
VRVPQAGPLLCLMNRDEGPIDWRLPPGAWQRVIDTAAEQPFGPARPVGVSELAGRSVQIFMLAS